MFSKLERPKKNYEYGNKLNKGTKRNWDLII